MIGLQIGIILGNGPLISLYVNYEVAIFKAAVEAAGSSLSDTEANALDDMVTALKLGGVFTKIRRWCPQIGATIDGVPIPLVANRGASVDVLNNYVSGDWSRTAGLQGNGSSAFISTGWVIDAADTATGFNAFCFRGTAITGGHYLYGCRGTNSIQRMVSGGTTIFANMATAVAITVATEPISAGIWANSRTSNVLQRLWKNNTLHGSNTTARPTLETMPYELTIGCLTDQLGARSGFLPAARRVAGYLLCEDLDSSEAAALQSAWTTFNTAVGR